MHRHRPRLSDPQHAAGALIFDRRIPPAFQMDGMIGAGQRETNATSTRRQQHHVEPGSSLFENG